MTRVSSHRTQYTYIEWAAVATVIPGSIMMLIGVVTLIEDALGYFSR